MAIKGAFSAGLVKGFATSLQDRIKERQERFNELVDNQMDTVRRAAPRWHSLWLKLRMLILLDKR